MSNTLVKATIIDSWRQGNEFLLRLVSVSSDHLGYIVKIPFDENNPFLPCLHKGTNIGYTIFGESILDELYVEVYSRK